MGANKVVIGIFLLIILSILAFGWRDSAVKQALIKKEKISGQNRLIALKAETETALDKLAEEIPVIEKNILVVGGENTKLEKDLRAEQERKPSLERSLASLNRTLKATEEEKDVVNPTLEEIEKKTISAREEKEKKEAIKTELREKEYQECQNAITKAAELMNADMLKADSSLWNFIAYHPKSVYRAAAMLARGEMFYESGDREQANSIYRRIIKEYPDSHYGTLVKSRLNAIAANEKYNGAGVGAVKIIEITITKGDE